MLKPENLKIGQKIWYINYLDEPEKAKILDIKYKMINIECDNEFCEWIDFNTYDFFPKESEALLHKREELQNKINEINNRLKEIEQEELKKMEIEEGE